jgi:GTPase involved in cell partitioning and DNA repair
LRFLKEGILLLSIKSFINKAPVASTSTSNVNEKDIYLLLMSLCDHHFILLPKAG